MRKTIVLSAILLSATVLTALVATGGRVWAGPPQQADFGQCIAMMARSGPNDHAAMMGLDNFGEVVQHCQAMHDPPAAD